MLRENAYRKMPSDFLITAEGYPFIAIGVLLTAATFFASWYYVSSIMVCLTLFVCFFFRNPGRESPNDKNLIIAPADGRIIAIEYLGNEVKISTFMSVFNCHVNRLPVDGIVKKVKYNPGRFFVASLDKASEHNERNSVFMEDAKGRKLVIVQIAGFVARRIVCYLKEGFSVMAGSRLGVIRFGSRVDLFLPKGTFQLEIKKDDRVFAGKTVIGRWL